MNDQNDVESEGVNKTITETKADIIETAPALATKPDQVTMTSVDEIKNDTAEVLEDDQAPLASMESDPAPLASLESANSSDLQSM